MSAAASETVPARRTIWRLTDGKAGHENQSRGLVAALRKHAEIDEHAIAHRGAWADPLRCAARSFPPGRALPRPDLILAVGHRTHWALLAARRAFGGRAVVLMKPTLPLAWFDLCLVPEHDGVGPRGNVVVTRGVLNTVTPSATRRDDLGLLLIGGPSAHHGWDGAGIVEQVRTVVAAEPSKQWRLTTSRRTPAGVVDMLRALHLPNLTVTPVEQTPPGWVAQHLAESAAVWVSEDSVSMVYESLTSGAAVGLLKVPRRGDGGRVGRGLDRLIAAGEVTRFDRWLASHTLPRPSAPLNEAERCAGEIVKRWWR